MTKMLAVRKEYGESFADVVKGFAAMGYSQRLTAAALEINRSYFRQLLTRFGLHQYFRKQADMRRDCKGGGKGWPKGTPRFSHRKPIEHGGVLWHPGEPTYHYLRERAK